MSGHDRSANNLAVLESCKRCVITVPYSDAFRRDRLRFFELGPQERRRALAQQGGAPNVDPAVLVDLTAEEPSAIGALLLKDLRALGPAVSVHQQGATFPALDVLRLVERERPQVADGAQGPTPIPR